MMNKLRLAFFYVTILCQLLACVGYNPLEGKMTKREIDWQRYAVGLSLAQKAALMFFQNEKNSIEQWKNCSIALEQPSLCYNLDGVLTAYVFDVTEGGTVKGIYAISAIKLWRPNLFAGTIPLELLVDRFRRHYGWGNDIEIKLVCVDGFGLMFKVKHEGKPNAYYYNTRNYPKAKPDRLRQAQEKSFHFSDDFVSQSFAIWNEVEEANLPINFSNQGKE